MEGTGPMRKITTVYRFKDYDIFLILCVLALSGAGVLLIGSAGPSYQYRQLAGVMLGLLVMGAVSIVDYRILIGHGWSCYAAALVLLFGVSVVGAISGGAARWIEIGPLRFQPSEMSKILLIVFFARLFHDFQDKMDRAVYVFFFVGVLLPPAALILEQPDLSTAVILVWIFLCMLFMAGLGYGIIGRALLLGIPLGGAGLFLVTRPGQTLINDYQYRRIMAWLSPQEWAQDSYQQRNSVMAIGSGGLWGKGLGNDSPLSVKNGNFLPEPHTDFIMAVAGEELGFWGCLMILLLLALIVEECIRIGLKTKDLSGRLICIGMAALIAGQSFVNLSVVTGLLPNTGLTLPFVSYGLTSLVSLYLGLGLVLNVGLQRSPFLPIPPR